MRLKDITEAKKQQPIKARDPNWRDMEALRKSGAAGSHGDKTKTIPRKEKYKKISMEDQFQEYMQEANQGSLDQFRNLYKKSIGSDDAAVTLRELIQAINDDALWSNEFPQLKNFVAVSPHSGSKVVTAKKIPGSSYDEKLKALVTAIDDNKWIDDTAKHLMRSYSLDVDESIKEELGADKEAQIKAWANKYKKYEGGNGDTLPAGFLEEHLNTGVPWDSIEAGEVEKYKAKYGDDALEDLSHEQVHDYPDEFPITNAFLKDLEKIFGYIPHGEEVEEIADVLRYYDGPKGIKEAQEPGEYRTIGGVKYYFVKNKSGKSKAFSGPTPAAKKYAQTGGNWYDEDVNEADPDTLGSMNPKMRKVLSKVDADDKAQAKADAEAKSKAEADKRAEAERLRKENPQMLEKYISMLKSHDWSYDYSDDHRVWKKGSDEAGKIRLMARDIDPDLELYKKYSPFHEQIEEKLSKSDDMGKWIDDFQDSDAPQFKGKSKAKRRQMAIAAKLSAESSDIFKALAQVDESVAVTQAGDISTTVSPHIAIGDKKTRKKYGLMGGLPNPPKAKAQTPKDNALDMKVTSIFGGPLKR